MEAVSLWALNNDARIRKKLRAMAGIYQVPVSPESQAYWNAPDWIFSCITIAAQEEETFKQGI